MEERKKVDREKYGGHCLRLKWKPLGSHREDCNRNGELCINFLHDLDVKRISTCK